MNLLLAFAPFIVFVVAERMFGIPIGLAAAALVAVALLVRDLLAPGRSPKLLEICTCLLFGGLFLLALALAAAAWFTGWYPEQRRRIRPI